MFSNEPLPYFGKNSKNYCIYQSEEDAIKCVNSEVCLFKEQLLPTDPIVSKCQRLPFADYIGREKLTDLCVKKNEKNKIINLCAYDHCLKIVNSQTECVLMDITDPLLSAKSKFDYSCQPIDFKSSYFCANSLNCLYTYP